MFVGLVLLAHMIITGDARPADDDVDVIRSDLAHGRDRIERGMGNFKHYFKRKVNDGEEEENYRKKRGSGKGPGRPQLPVRSY